jgi:2-oxoglutarate ferredoxin oxidoreductase subunit delta
MKKGRININENRCKGCQLCVQACKQNEIKISDRINRHGYNVAEFRGAGRCIACALCAVMCPDCAIEVIEITEEVKK